VDEVTQVEEFSDPMKIGTEGKDGTRCLEEVKQNHRLTRNFTTSVNKQAKQQWEVRFQVLTAASLKFSVFGNVASCSHVEVD
jgi:hypothetical protein